jgi:hypothetical protein
MLSKILPGWTIKKAENDEVLVVAPKGNGAHIANKGALANRILHQLAGALVDAGAQAPADASASLGTHPADSDARKALDELESWLVCAGITTADDMAKSFPHMLALVQSTLAKYKPKDPGMHKHNFNFARHEDGNVTTLGVLAITSRHADKDATWDALIDAVTQWVATTDAGRQAWEGSCQDLNIGDLDSFDAFKDANFLGLLAERGLAFQSLTVSDANQARSFDEVLVDLHALYSIETMRERG